MSIRSQLQQMIEHNESVQSRIFAITVQILIVVSLLSFSISTLPNLAPATIIWLDRLEMFIVIIFTIEYILRLVSSPKPVSFIFSFYGLIDLIAIVPFYLAVGLDLRVVRSFRLLRLVLIFKLLKYSKAMDRFRRAMLIAKEELLLFMMVACILLYLSAVGIYYCENAAQPELFKSVFHSLWWAVTTLTTVGYGDMVPITVGGKIFTFFILMLGLGIVALPTGLIASALSEVRKADRKKAAKIAK
ncbi:ion transporter [Algibacillus agarilyticus]|uniref:ion transporter n=1 Tax=Algibacillus agarilyticus TaxID=2234133 RepID=UPI001E2A0998|nr:ion transporter [Algibacillus agarilyticus]